MSGKARVAGVVLAAGLSRRFGGEKLLARLGGRPLGGWAVRAALEAPLSQVIVVTRPELRAALVGPEEPVRLVINHAPAEGQSGSLGLGLAAVEPRASHALFLLADQPLVDAALIARFVDAAGDGAELAALDGEGGSRPPALFARRFFGQLLSRSGDAGGREIMAAHAGDIRLMAAIPPEAAWDVDSPEDLARLARAAGLPFDLGER